jgi:aldehyde dehydrogenase (NAD+)
VDVRNPRTGAIDYSFDPPSRDELAGVCARLRSAQPAWEASGAPARAAALLAWRDSMLRHRDELVGALVRDTGRFFESALEVDAIRGTLERWARNGPDALAEEPARAAAIPIVSVRQAMQPYALAGVISPWNFPLLLSLIDAIPALVSGCAVVVKPSEIAPRFIEPLARTIAEVPELARVLAFVAGAGETGRDIVDLVDLVCFTGSVPTGRAVGEQAARRFIPAFLELGGKDAAIVTASADIERATSAILWGSTANAGQSCLSIERVYVEQPVHDAFVERLAQKARALRLAVPEPQSGEIGPIIAEKQVAIIERHLSDAARRGAKALTGGEMETHDGGAYCPATVLTGADHSMLVMTEETFGPVIPVMRARDADHAVELANDSTYGLSGAVFAGTTDEAIAIARRVRAGGISINDAALTALVYDGEKNSFNLSGLGGSRMGPASLRRFARRQAFLIAESSAPDPWWYPSLQEH